MRNTVLAPPTGADSPQRGEMSPQDNPLKDLYTAYADFGVGWGDARQIIFGNPS